jgi:hypothetical protein
MAKREDVMSLVDACRELGIAYPAGYRLLLTGALVGERRGGRWVVSCGSVARVARETEKAETAQV